MHVCVCTEYFAIKRPDLIYEFRTQKYIRKFFERYISSKGKVSNFLILNSRDFKSVIIKRLVRDFKSHN